MNAQKRNAVSSSASRQRRDTLLGILHAQFAGDELGEERVAQGGEGLAALLIVLNHRP